MTNTTLIQLRYELACAAANLQKCKVTYKSLKAFKKDSYQDLAACAAQLHQAAAALRDHADHLTQIAEDIQITYSRIMSGMILPEEMYDVHAHGHRNEF